MTLSFGDHWYRFLYSSLILIHFFHSIRIFLKYERRRCKAISRLCLCLWTLCSSNWVIVNLTQKRKRELVTAIDFFGEAYDSISVMDNLTAPRRKDANRKCVMKRKSTLTTIVKVVTMWSLFMGTIEKLFYALVKLFFPHPLSLFFWLPRSFCHFISTLPRPS